jgi:5'-3' exonuclease
VKYTERVVGEVGPTTGVYIAVDGVVPMAKMRQQRLRRFKSAWERGLVSGAGAGAGAESGAVSPWDSNAITPGTAFMSRLRKTLEDTIARRGLPWKLSSADEPGEGEQKLMHEWRNGDSTGSRYAVYGLDADLIVLSLLTQNTLHREARPVDVWLFREQMDGEAEEGSEPAFSWFDIQILREQLCGELRGSRVSLRDYCFAMSFLGNDFLPSSLSLKMREDGHEELMQSLRRLSRPLVDPRSDAPCVEGVKELIGGFADVEETRVRRSVGRKGALAARVREETGLGQANWALDQFVERSLLEGDWRTVYRRQFQGGAKPAVAAEQYLQGMQWIWNYYRGTGDICYNWMFPWSLPPLWSDVAAWLTERGALPAVGPTLLRAADIQPVEQLCLVLPPASGGLVPVAGLHRRFAAAAPWLFPAEFGFHSAGKRWFWECEPEIPVPTLLEVKRVLRDLV